MDCKISFWYTGFEEEVRLCVDCLENDSIKEDLQGKNIMLEGYASKLEIKIQASVILVGPIWIHFKLEV